MLAAFGFRADETKARIDKIIVLVADFNGPSANEFGITETLLRQLREATRPYTDLIVQGLEETITEKQGSKYARQKASENNAKIIQWGWYAITRQKVSLTAYFEVLFQSSYLADSSENKVIVEDVAKLDNFEIHNIVASKFSFLTLITIGIACLEKKDFDEAIKRFDAAIAVSDTTQDLANHAIAHFYKGIACQKKEDLNSAKIDYDEAIKCKPNFAEAFNNRASIYKRNKEYPLAIFDYNAAVRLSPNFSMAHYHRGQTYYLMGDSAKANADYKTAVELEPAYLQLPYSKILGKIPLSNSEEIATQPGKYDRSDAFRYFALGKSCADSGKYGLAVKYFTKAISLDPTFVEAYHQRGHSYGKQFQWKQAVNDFKKAQSHKPNNAEILWDLGSAELEMGNAHEAITNLIKSLKQEDSLRVRYQHLLPRVLYSLQVCASKHYSDGDFKHAVADFTQILQNEKSNGGIWSNRALAFHKDGDLDSAIADYNRAIELQPFSSNTYNNRGIAHYDKKEYELAIADHTAAIELAPQFSLAFLNRGIAYKNIEKYDLAHRDFNKAIKLDDSLYEAYNNRANLFLRTKDPDSALADFQKALNLAPHNSKAREQIKAQMEPLQKQNSQ